MAKHNHLVEELRDDLYMGILPLAERFLHGSDVLLSLWLALIGLVYKLLLD